MIFWEATIKCGYKPTGRATDNLQEKDVMKYAPIFILLILLIAILSCRNSSPKKVKHSDPFYNDSGEGKFLVVPLIKPYRVVTDEGADIGWQMDLSENPPVTCVLRIEKIAVAHGVIMIFAPTNPQIFPTDPVWHWVVIIPERQIEEGFADEGSFLNYIRQFDIESPNWIEPMEAFKQFESTGCLNWIPDCP